MPAWAPAAWASRRHVLLLATDHFTPHLHVGPTNRRARHHVEEAHDDVVALAIHNLPEGMAVGVVLAGLAGIPPSPLASVVALSLGIAIQNVPEAPWCRCR